MAKKTPKKRSFRSVFKKRATPSQVRLIKEPRSKLRFVKKAEREANPDKFSPKGSYLVRKGVRKIGDKTPFVRTIDKQDWRVDVHHGRAARLRAEGRLGYGPRAEERAIPKRVQTFELTILKRKYAKLENAERRATPWGTRERFRGPQTYTITQKMRDKFWSLRQRKLDGEMLDDGDWHQMIDQARALRDPHLAALMKSA
jgi:hypothetical protein